MTVHLRKGKLGIERVRLQGQSAKQQIHLHMWCLKQEHESGRQGSASPAMVIGRHITTLVSALCSPQTTSLLPVTSCWATGREQMPQVSQRKTVGGG